MQTNNTCNSELYLTNRGYKVLEIAHMSLAICVISGFTVGDVIGLGVQALAGDLAPRNRTPTCFSDWLMLFF